MYAWQKDLFFAWAFLEVSSVNNEVLIVLTTTWLWSLSNQTRDGGTERRGEKSIICLNFL